ncbi:hypothetical protein H9Q69_013269 [Fusarium xylarioides]|uniref:Uncharacterized protein n=1 Tax=Fusarium xylarioides TaxID=221167 RepID=A0A9P7HZZ1_9HYPO|nr:hypothetical protein H9Q70_011020 [Fusarium xylarioides]KAG5766392.1 hypothetical protein H9Q72_005527 [Fusarium xylarioides]KAG5787657.1 hypothetical protein H9Q69_013269 [Fusarium xylarioides]KAG5812258.1 hypothetical protein H9Q71_004456 [Fusarium xylarioides]KAG5825677.1 hypothetical protein H9Q74_004239 [Fusarium xylarioides]
MTLWTTPRYRLCMATVGQTWSPVHLAVFRHGGMQQYLRHTFVTIDDLVSSLERARAPVVASIVKTLNIRVSRDHEETHFLLAARLLAPASSVSGMVFC